MSGFQKIGVDVSEAAPTAQFTLGAHHATENGDVFKYVQYAEGSGAVAAVVGNVAYYTSGGGYTASEVTSDLTDSDEIGAGVLQTAMPDGYFGWVKIKGSATLASALTAGTDGDILTPTGATDGTLDLTTAATDHQCAIAVDAAVNEVACDFPF